MGFDRNRFICQELNAELFCAICLNILESPVEAATCEHIFCNECINIWLLREAICPIDRKPLTARSLKKIARYFRSLLGDLEITCDYVSSGCSTILKLDLLATHVKQCSFNPDLFKTCPAECGAVLRRGDVDSEFPPHSCVVYLLKVIQEAEKGPGEGRVHELAQVIENQEKANRALVEELLVTKSKAMPSTRVVERIVTVSYEHKKNVDLLKGRGLLTSARVYRAMVSVDYKNFFFKTPTDADVIAQRLEESQAYTNGGPKILDIFYKHKYIATCISLMVGPTGSVVAMTHTRDDLYKVKKDHRFLHDEGRLKLIHEPDEKARRKGHPPLAPYDVIILYDASDFQQVGEQLRLGGKMYCPNSSHVWGKTTGGSIVQITGD